jgi:hypothetical protein
MWERTTYPKTRAVVDGGILHAPPGRNASVNERAMSVTSAVAGGLRFNAT